MNPLSHIMIHCTATPAGRDVSPLEIIDWHVNQRGWKVVGYAKLIGLNGDIHTFRQHNGDPWLDPAERSNGAGWMNDRSYHLCYVGGMNAAYTQPEDTRTGPQRSALELVVRNLLSQYPDAVVCGHNQYSNKACPSFHVPQWAADIGIAPQQIDTHNSVLATARLG